MISTLLGFLASISNAQPAAKKASHKTHARTHYRHAKHHVRHRYRRGRRSSWKRHGQQKIAPDRAREIQDALIREHYLTGEANGQWDTRTQAAMERFQADNGWQNKVTPDSRALIKLGLGPDYSQEQLLNLPSAAQTDAIASAGSGSSTISARGVSRDKQ
ncbi:MAG: peptidoglycan-binding domain-containing protein [Actinomycetota bacterium]